MQNRVGYLCGALCFIAVLYGCSMSPDGSAVEPAVKAGAVLLKTTVLATVAGSEPRAANQTADQKIATGGGDKDVVIHESGRGYAYVQMEKGLSRVIHNGKPGKAYQRVEQVTLSPDGKRVAYAAGNDATWQMVVDGIEGPVFAGISGILFSPDSRHIAYQAAISNKSHVVVDNLVSAPFDAYYGEIYFSSDSQNFLFVEDLFSKKSRRLLVTDLALKSLKVIDSIGNLIITDRSKSKIAAITTGNGLERVVEIDFVDPGKVKYGPVFDKIINMAFSNDGSSLAYSVEKGRKRALVLNGKEEMLPDANVVEAPVIRPLKDEAVVVLLENDKVYLHQAFAGQAGIKVLYDDLAEQVFSKDGNSLAYVARNGQKYFVVVNGNDGPPFEKIVSPQFSPDGKKLVYRARQNGKRFVVVADLGGRIIRQHPFFDQVFQPVFTPDGTSIAYGAKDGQKLVWKVEKL